MNRERRILMYWGGGLERAGGIGRMAGNLLQARAAAGRSDRVVCLDTRGTGSIAWAPAHLLATLLRTVCARLSGRAVIAHVHMADAGSTVRKVVLCRALALLGIPYLLHLHPGNYHTYFRVLPDWGKRLVRRAFADAALAVVLGDCWARLAAGELGMSPGRIRVIPNGVPDPGARQVPMPDGPPLVLLLGELAPWKGVAELIAALGTLRDRSWRLVCAGRGDPADYIAAAAAAGIAERVRFPGWIDRERSALLLRQATIVAVPSLIEGFSVALIEALANGVAVVATPVGAHPDVLRDDENALLAAPGDVAGLARALALLLDDPVRRGAIARAGRASYEAQLDIRVIEARFAQAHDEMFAAKRLRLPVAAIGTIPEHESIR